MSEPESEIDRLRAAAMGSGSPESGSNGLKVAVVVVILLCGAASLGFFGSRYFGGGGAQPVSVDSQNLAQIQQQLNGLDKRLSELEKRRKAEPAKSSTDVKEPEAAASSQAAIPRAPRNQIKVSPPSALQAQPGTAQPSSADPASAEALAKLQQGMGALQAESSSNREAWQATTNRLAEVAGELGAQHGQILQNQDELHRFLARGERTTLTFELRRSSTPEPVGPLQLSLQSANQKSRRYTLCVYVQNSCVQMKDRVLFEVVQVMVSPGSPPLELIATKVGKDEIVGYLEVPSGNSGH
ncbi:MAG TPA: hypothetical protein VFO34_09205 [Candidatus Acidoferrales bacterium]|nr:hypothetical protein [Candidatus Acidoferrales bacterium]